MLIRKNKAQMFPFLIVILAIVIMALMITVNIGKIGLTKTRTGNAADAGALAGCSIHSITLNVLAQQNQEMIYAYEAEVAAFVVPMTICYETKRYAAYIAFSAAQTAWFAMNWHNIGDKGYAAASDAAFMFAFSNSGMDEAKRRLSGESYDDWLKRKSYFEQWMEHEPYKGESNCAYTWEGSVQPLSACGGSGKNKFKVDVNAPSFPGLIPMPGILVGVYMDFIPICISCATVTCCKECDIEIELLWKCLQSAGANATTIPRDVERPSCCPPGCSFCGVISGSIMVSGGMTSKGTTIIPGTYQCGSTAVTEILYYVPIAFIADIVDDNPKISVKTNRIEPAIDLGLWQMRYEDPAAAVGKGITSQAEAKTKGGEVGPAPDASYDCGLTSAK